MRRILLFILTITLLIAPSSLGAQDKHWASDDIEKLKQIYHVEIIGGLNKPAEPILQDKLFKLAGLEVTPQEGMIRFWAFSYFVEPLNVEVEDSEEANELLSKYVDKCNYCWKANKIFSKAEKAGLLKGRLTAEGLRLDPKQLVSNAELAVLAIRYIEIRELANY